MNGESKTLKDVKSMESLIAGIDFCDLDENFSKIFVDKNNYDMQDFLLGQKIGRNNKAKNKTYIKIDNKKNRI